MKIVLDCIAIMPLISHTQMYYKHLFSIMQCNISILSFYSAGLVDKHPELFLRLIPYPRSSKAMLQVGFHMQQQGGSIFAMIHSHSSTQVAVHSPMLHGPRYLVTPMVSLSLLGKGNFPPRLLHINFTFYSMHEAAISSV